ncbi:hypothetical protein BWI17_07265 [Betaproteobacteria bacterium GR16-43]|nr:hypothetical protein BWI17_07265 [Betaproteobacteria bacterium GR16-43]
MNRKIAFRIAIIAAPILGLLLYAALNWYEWREYPQRVGNSEEAKRNPHLALERFYARMGANPTFARSHVDLAKPPEGGVLILAARRLAFMTPTRVREIDAWVQRGGLLVAEVESPGIDDPLFANYGVETNMPTGPARGKRSRSETPPAPLDTPVAPKKGDKPIEKFASVPWPDAAKPLRVSLWGPGMRIAGESDPEQIATATQNKNLVFVSFAVGKGRVVLLADFSFLRNNSISNLDHAEFAWHLAGDGARPAMLFLRPPSLSLGTWLRDNAWPVILAGAVLLLLWLGRAIPRFGPLEPDAPPDRRSLQEHLRAAGRFVWSRGEASQLIDAVRERVWRVATRRRSGLKGLAHSRAEEMLAGLAERPVADIRRAMHGADTNPVAFVATAGALQDIEAGLAHRTHLSRPNRHSRPDRHSRPR